ncbi:hypothetical protein MPRF_28370 [Mycolicibacterium parafortuitum]|uniref:Uncharacterized protein n=1 Tax=Mycolicibacterium parafortuitum TaxID=39692 RepID=A0A7I7U3L1_MYCPF|nr:hypothetical protein MPRF_28370 [Mycolicibacterium parafortuitum]
MPTHVVLNVYCALKSGSGCRVATLVPIFCDANVTTVYRPLQFGGAAVAAGAAQTDAAAMTVAAVNA